MRELATIQRIGKIHPIEGRDRIGHAEVLGWRVIVNLADFREGDLCVYFEIDSVLPKKPMFAFMEKRGYRVRTMKMAGVVSQGLCMTLESCGIASAEEGTDVTDLLGVTKYDPQMEDETVLAESRPQRKNIRSIFYRCPLTNWLAKRLWGNGPQRRAWPAFVAKTDEPRAATMPWILEKKEIPFEAHEKVDGQSGTFFVRKKLFGYEFGVCSRNLRLFQEDNSSYWSIARKTGMRDILIRLQKEHFPASKWVCIQGEIIGPGIQQNKYHRKDYELYCFNLISEASGKIDSFEASQIVKEFGLSWVPLLNRKYTLPDTIEERDAYAEGESKLEKGVMREGIVFRNYREHLSFKQVSTKYLLHWKE